MMPKNFIFISHELVTQQNTERVKYIFDKVDNCHVIVFDNNMLYKSLDDYAAIFKIPVSKIFNVLWRTTTDEEVDTFSDRMAHRVATYINKDLQAEGGCCKFVVLDCDGNHAMHTQLPNNYIECEKTMTEDNAKSAVWVMTNFGTEKKMTDKIFFTSDTHFGHANIMTYCNRPFANVEEMDKILIENWNSVVPKDGIVWHLGDFCLGPKQSERISEIVHKLNGRIKLVLGNHDHHSVDFYYKAGFNRVYDRKVIINDYIVLSHEPMLFLNNNCPFINLFGHVHDSNASETWTKTGGCMCVERHDYKPVCWTEIEKHLNAEQL